MEEGLLPEDHRRKHCSQTPHVQTIVVLLEINQQFWTFEVTRGNADIVLSSRVVELSKTPVDQAQLRNVSKRGEVYLW